MDDDEPNPGGTVPLGPVAKVRFARRPAHIRAFVCGAEFMSTSVGQRNASFINREAVEACVSIGVRERPPVRATWYKAFVDPSGGSGTDSMTLAIGHREGGVAVIDVVREAKPPFSPEAVVEEFCPLLRAYRVSSVQGDKFAGEWPREQFKKRRHV